MFESLNLRERDVVGLEEIGPAHAELVGGKGANLGALTRLEGLVVPHGVCVTTHAFRRVLTPSILTAIDRLSGGGRPAEIREALEHATLPDALVAALTSAIDPTTAYAVRSSATSEDSPSTSFAGQHDTFLNVRGVQDLLEHVRRCWASLFSDRAVAYRAHHGIDHREVHMAVVVQRMVDAEASGVLFTADPLTGDRKTTMVEACLGLGAALVSGLVDADVFRVRGGALVDRTIATERVAAPSRRPALTDAQVLALAELGGQIQAHFGQPQDIEWCLVDDHFEVVQSRPITTLFPIPRADDDENHVYVSVGHQQMMTDAMKPLGLSVWQLSTARPMAEAGGRLFVDVSRILASPSKRGALLETLGKSDPLIRDALQTVLDRGDVIASDPPGAESDWVPPSAGPAPLDADPSIVARLVARSEASVTTLAREIEGHEGVALLDFIASDLPELKRILGDPESHRVVMAGMEAAWWLDDRMQQWLGEANVSDTLSQSVPNNVTARMGLALMDVADAIRPHPEVVRALERATDATLLRELSQVDGGDDALAALRGWLDAYGMRGVGEIDITRPRFHERPTSLVAMLLSNVRNFTPGESTRRFARGAARARALEADLLARLRRLPEGDRKADEAARMVARVRTFAGYREYPKYGLVSRYAVYKRALLREAERLVRGRVLDHAEDIFFLRFEELHEVVRTRSADPLRIARRKAAYARHCTLSPPRVLTSDGEGVSGSYRRTDLPEGALTGLAVSAGVVEGRARVILDLGGAHVEPGDILVTRYTDPSWTPLFVGIAGLVTEVGGLMTHGAVIAREFGVPAVVGVEGATTRIRDGQWIRVDGVSGVIEVLRETR